MGRFRVAGHFYSGMYEYDSKLAYMSLEAAQKFLRMPGEVSGIDFRNTRSVLDLTNCPEYSTRDLRVGS
jgi:ABC-type lipoprotein release transport system permease subunit